MKIQTVILKETARIAIGCILLSLIMILIFFVSGKLTIDVFLGAFTGSVIAVLNFLALGISLQKTVKKSEGNIKSMVHLSYSARMLVIFITMALLLYLGWFNPIALMLPLIFPRISIFIFGFIKKKDKFEGENNG